jgi:hypothetical protein
MNIPAQRMNFIVMSPLMAGLRRPASISIHGMTGAAAETQARHAKIATDHSAQQVGEASAMSACPGMEDPVLRRRKDGVSPVALSPGRSARCAQRYIADLSACRPAGMLDVPV